MVAATWCVAGRRTAALHSGRRTVVRSWMSGERERRSDACASSDKSEKIFRFNGALSCLLSERALKVFSCRNPSKLALLRGFRQSAISLWAHIAAAVLRDLNPQQWSRGSKMPVAGESGHRWLTAAGAFRWRFPNTLACAARFRPGQYRNVSADWDRPQVTRRWSARREQPITDVSCRSKAAVAGRLMAQPVYPQPPIPPPFQGLRFVQLANILPLDPIRTLIVIKAVRLDCVSAPR
jgi:hypothetical protein